MADTKGNDPKAGPDKPDENKSGAVKPPVLDLTARESTPGDRGPTKPEQKPESKLEQKPAGIIPPGAKPTSKPAPPAAKTEAGFPIGATIAGGVLGLAAAYGLALGGLWPTQPAPAPAADPRIQQFATAIPELETVTQTTQSELAAVNQRIAALENTPPAAPAPAEPPANAAALTAAEPAPPVDLSPIEAEIAALQSRVDALPTETIPPLDVEALNGDIADLGTRLDELAARLGTAEAGLRTLDTTVSQTSAALAQQPSDIGAVLQLPLVLSGLETAFANGRPFETELASLRAASPKTQPPLSVANAAATGLPRPDLIQQRFAEVLPAIIAGRPADPNAQWQDGALDWFASAIALRPTGELEGDTPQAITSRLESAIARRDFGAAKTLFDDLPAAMRAAAGDVPTMVAAQADAAAFLADVRTQALSGEAAQ